MLCWGSSITALSRTQQNNYSVSAPLHPHNYLLGFFLLCRLNATDKKKVVK